MICSQISITSTVWTLYLSTPSSLNIIYFCFYSLFSQLICLIVHLWRINCNITHNLVYLRVVLHQLPFQMPGLMSKLLTYYVDLACRYSWLFSAMWLRLKSLLPFSLIFLLLPQGQFLHDHKRIHWVRCEVIRITKIKLLVIFHMS